jgi:hypothetical protein
MELSNMPIEIFNLIAQHTDAPTYVAMKSTCKEANEQVIDYEVMRKENARKVCVAYMQAVVREVRYLEVAWPFLTVADMEFANELYGLCKFEQIANQKRLDTVEMKENKHRQSYYDANKHTFSLIFTNLTHYWVEEEE